MKQSLELFSGSGQISAIFQEFGFATWTVDNNKKLKPDFCFNILNLTKEHLPANISLFWASPDCSKFSRAAAQRHWNKKLISYRNYDYSPATPEAEISANLVARTVELIAELNPGVWFIENPVGRLPYLNSMRQLGHYRYCVNYADWGFSYGKETYIFTNQLLPLPTIVQKRTGPGVRSVANKYKRSLVPAALIRFLISHSNFP